MPTDTYTFKLTIAGEDAVKSAKHVRTAVEKELKGITAVLDFGSVAEADERLKELQKTARGVGKALTTGFRKEVTKLIDQIGDLQEQVNMVVRAGAGPVEQALEGLGAIGLDALDIVDTGSTKATQKMARLTTEIKGAQEEIGALQRRVAELGARPIVPAGSLTNEVRTLSELYKELTGSRWPQVRRMHRDMAKEMAPIAREVEKQAEAARAEAAPAYERLKTETDELRAELDKIVTKMSELQVAHRQYRAMGEWQTLAAEAEQYRQAIFSTEAEMGKLRSAMMGTARGEAMSQLRHQQEAYLRQLEESTLWWKELTRGAGEHADVIEFVAKQDREAGAALAEMIAAWERIRKLQTSISRGIGTMQRMGEKVELPPGTEGTLATLVIVERTLGESTEMAADQIVRQRKELGKLTRALEAASQAAGGLDRTQRAAIKRLQMVAEREIREATKTTKGLTTEEAGAAVMPVLAQLEEQVRAIRTRTTAEMAKMEQEGTARSPFGWIIQAAAKAKSMVVGESIIPDMVTAINEWLARIGVDDPFTDLAMDAQTAAERIHTGLQQRLQQLSTEEARAELDKLQAELAETAQAIESQLVVTGQASQRYKQAWADYAAEVQRVRGDDPAAMGLVAQGKALRGTGVRGEFATLEIIDEGYQAISTEVKERQRLTQEEMGRLAELENRYTAMKQAAMSLERELTQRRIAALEKAMGEALDEQDVERFEQLNQEYIAEQDRFGELANELAYEREMITSRAVTAAEEQLQQARAHARRTIPTGAGTEVAGEVIMPTITKTQVRNVQQYTQAIQGLGQALQEIRADVPVIAEAEQKRLVETTRAVTKAEEAERRLTAVKRSELRMQEIDKEKEAQAEVEAARAAAQAEIEAAKKTTAETKALTQAAAYEKKQEAKATATSAIEEERRLTTKMKEEERRRTLQFQDEMRKRSQAARESRKRMVPTQAEIARYGGGTLGMLSWSVQEAQAMQMGVRMLTYDIQHLGRSAMMASAAMTGPPVLAMRRYRDYTRLTNRTASAMGLASGESEALRSELIKQSEALGMAKPEVLAEGMYTWVTGIGASARNLAELRDVIESTIPIQHLTYMQQLDLGQATETTAGIMAEFRMETSETARVVEILDATADRTFAAVSDLGEAFKFVGPIAHELDISMEETAATFGLLSDANIKGSMAGRAMRQLMIRLVKTTEEEDEALNKLLNRNEQLGQSWRDLAFPEGEFIGMARWIDLLAAATEDLSDQQRANLLATISTANELPALTALVSRQIEAREHGINVIRAEEKVMRGILDEEVQAYAKWEEETTGNIMNLESAHDSFERKVRETTESEAYQFDKLRAKWDALILTMGEQTLRTLLPALEPIAATLEDVADIVEANPWLVQAALAAGGVVGAVGVISMSVGKLMRMVTMLRTVGAMIEGWKAAQAEQTAAAATQTTAAGTQIAAADTQLVAAQTQAATGQSLGKGLFALVGSLGLVVAALSAEKYVVEKAGIPDWMQTQAARGTETYEQYLTAMREITAGRLEPLTEEQWKAVHAGQELKDVVVETTEETETWRDELADCTDEMRDLKEAEREAKQEAEALGNELMELPPAIGVGLAAFTEQELQAIDELESYLRRRNEMIEDHNEELVEMERAFLEKEEEQHQEYLKKRDKLERELQEVTEEPLWESSREVKKAREKQAEAEEEYQKRIAKAEEEHRRKLRNLREDHLDKMEDLVASRDARGILAERRRYKRSVRDANEHYQDLLDREQERRDESIQQEEERITEMRQKRKEDIEEKLRELDEEYQEEAQKRQKAHLKEMEDKRRHQAEALRELERAHSERLARIMGWEERVRDALRNSYIGREDDLRQHLANMERMYLETYSMLSQLSPEAMTPEEYRQWHEEVRGHQMGGYARAGTYRLGEAGPEFVMSAPTTRAMERAVGHLTQAKMLGLAGGGTWHGKLDIHVTADQHFSPEFRREAEAAARAEIVRLSGKIAASQPGAHMIH